MSPRIGNFVLSGISIHPKTVVKNIEYGTAGFRTKGSDLDCVVYRMGILAALRSKSVKGMSIGVMITASHNPEEDNGVKLVDPMGEMLEAKWEEEATHFANVQDQLVEQTLARLVETFQVDLDSNCVVYIGSDTRKSSPALVKALVDGATDLKATIKDYGLLTTPQLHFMVRCSNDPSYGQATEFGYYTKLGSAFSNLCRQMGNPANYTVKLIIDGANGVGAPKIKSFLEYLDNRLEIELFNDGSSGALNHNCGADFVKISQTVPEGVDRLDVGCRSLSLDGDADRIIYFYLNDKRQFRMLDGDKIATLVTRFIRKLVAKCGLDLNVLVVQTAYANGSSTNYIKNILKVGVACVPTGVKYLHHKAQEAEIGIYFEANGHGTVLFSPKAISKIVSVSESSDLSVASEAITLLRVMDVINQTVGDAISDMLLVELILRFEDWSIADWDAMYDDLPNRQLKVKVKDRNSVANVTALQSAIDQLVQGHPNWRSFVRASGTEDIVRVYAEADTAMEANSLAHRVSLLVYDLAEGIGPKPSL